MRAARRAVGPTPKGAGRPVRAAFGPRSGREGRTGGSRAAEHGGQNARLGVDGGVCVGRGANPRAAAWRVDSEGRVGPGGVGVANLRVVVSISPRTHRMIMADDLKGFRRSAREIVFTVKTRKLSTNKNNQYLQNAAPAVP